MQLLAEELAKCVVALNRPGAPAARVRLCALIGAYVDMLMRAGHADLQVCSSAACGADISASMHELRVVPGMPAGMHVQLELQSGAEVTWFCALQALLTHLSLVAEDGASLPDWLAVLVSVTRSR